MFLLTLIPVVLVLQLATAFPHSPVASWSELPPDVNHIAHDERTGKYLAYRADNTVVGGVYDAVDKPNPMPVPPPANETSSCFPLSSADARTMVGWNKLEAYANKNWGTGKRQVVVNPTQYLEQNAIVCPTDKVVEIKFVGGSNCLSDRVTAEGRLVGTNGTVRLTLWQGYSNSAGWTVTRTSAYGVSGSVTATFKIPGVADIGGTIDGRATITNDLASSFDTRVDNMMSQDLWVTSERGKTCYARMNTKTCNVMAKGRLRQSASGWIWFNYDTPTGPGGHRKWAVNIERTLSLDDRSSFLEFVGSMKGQVRTKYEATCKAQPQ